jgi:hypothetical protein
MMFQRAFAAALLLLFASVSLSAQSAVPIISGGAQFLSTTEGGVTFFQPVIAPVVAVPLGEHFLIESRATFDELIFRENGASGPYHAKTFSSIDYLQLDYIVNPHLTIVVGDFLAPFNIYNDRMSAVWIHDIGDPPLIAGVGTRTSGSSEGGMVRGVAIAKKEYELHYTAYFSALVSGGKFGAGRTAGARVGVFIPSTRLEVGVSYQRFLQDLHLNSSGFYGVWQPRSQPIELRTEYAHTRGGQGYWLQGSYRMSHFGGPDSLLGRLQPIARVQQFWLGTPSPNDVLPGADTRRVDFGMNYYLPHEVRLNGTYGRQFSPLGNANAWNFSITYRFLFPLIPGKG